MEHLVKREVPGAKKPAVGLMRLTHLQSVAEEEAEEDGEEAGWKIKKQELEVGQGV